MGTLKLIADEPDYYSELFGYNEYADRLFELLSNSLPEGRPFAICLDGKWGQGKTSLLMRIHNKIISDSKATKIKTIWFDAWKNEDIDPTEALLLKILDQYPDSQDSIPFKTVEGVLENQTMGPVEKRDRSARRPASLHLKSVMDGRETLPASLDDLIGTNNKFFIFIDHLDHCEIQYVKEMLKAITIHLKANNIRFVVAADLNRLHNIL